MEFLLNDLHCHSTLSSCCTDPRMTPKTILDYAEQQGYSALCLTDHLWDAAVPGASDWYAPQDIAHVRSALPLPQGNRLRFHFGCETELPANGIPALAPEHFEQFDFVVIPVNHMHMKGLVRPAGVDTPSKMATLVENRLERLLELNLPFHKVGLAHLTVGLMFSEGSVADVVACMNEARLLRIFKGYAQAGAGIELNASCFEGWGDRQEEMLLMYRIAREAGCLFYCCSDSHSVEKMADIPRLLPNVIRTLGLTDAQQYRIPD